MEVENFSGIVNERNQGFTFFFCCTHDIPDPFTRFNQPFFLFHTPFYNVASLYTHVAFKIKCHEDLKGIDFHL